MKIRGRLVYFGRKYWEKALDDYCDQREELYADRTPTARPDELTVPNLRNLFLDVKARVW